MYENKVIVALDGMTQKRALKIATLLKGHVWGFKVNDLLFEDGSIITRLKKFGNVFADAKLHDIPNTVANSVAKLSDAGADFITVHASGGIEMMKAAKKNAGTSKIIAVTVLTSELLETEKKVLKLVHDAIEAGADGVVCSGLELKSIIAIQTNLLKIVPGIRPRWYTEADDQIRTMAPDIALQRGADHIVIGRPITSSKDPLRAITRL